MFFKVAQNSIYLANNSSTELCNNKKTPKSHSQQRLLGFGAPEAPASPKQLLSTSELCLIAVQELDMHALKLMLINTHHFLTSFTFIRKK